LLSLSDVTPFGCGPLAAWASAWLAGTTSSDEVLRAIAPESGSAYVVGLDGSSDAVPMSQVLINWRKRAAAVRLVLPIPGDVRGVPGPAQFLADALDVGEAVHGGGLGLVPHLERRGISSAPPSVRWVAYEVGEPAEDFVSVADAQHDLAEAIRRSATMLSATEAATWTDDVANAVSAARRAGDRVNLPPGFPPRAVQLVAQAQRIDAVVRLAAAESAGGAIDPPIVETKSAALRSLATAVRRALLAGYNAVGADR
jgi:hypothetical protein